MVTQTQQPVTLVADAMVTGSSVTGPAWVTVHEGRILAAGEGQGPAGGEVVPVQGTLVPGLVDIHHHGALGHDYGLSSREDTLRVAGHHRGRGSATLVASVATAPLDHMVERVELLGELHDAGEIAGIHLEGPYLDAGHRGCHATDLLRPPAVGELRRLVDAGQGALRMVTLAPELPGAEAAIRFLVEQGVTVAVGHTSCTAEQARAAFGWGATVLTHAFNGMPALHHREPGPLGAALFDERVTIELIFDGHHVATEPAAVLTCVAPERLALISDAMAATGLGDGDYVIGATPVRVTGAVARATTNGSLAGSTITLSDAFTRAMDLLGYDVAGAAAAASAIPARALGLAVPRLAAGEPANLLVVEGSRITRVMQAGDFLP